MLADQTRWPPGHGKTPVPSHWQATRGSPTEPSTRPRRHDQIDHKLSDHPALFTGIHSPMMATMATDAIETQAAQRRFRMAAMLKETASCSGAEWLMGRWPASRA